MWSQVPVVFLLLCLFHLIGRVYQQAPIMMTAAVQSMKSQMKKASSEIKAKLNEAQGTKNIKSHRGQKQLDRQRPATIIGHNSLKTQRPPRPAQPPHLKSKTGDRPVTQYKLIDVQEDESPQDDDSLTFPRISLNLSTDPDILNQCQRSASSELLSGEKEFVSDDSSSVDTPSSGAQTPAEIEDSGIPYVDLDANRKLNNAATEFAPLPRSSPVIKKANGAARVAIDGPQPVPAPRSRSTYIKRDQPTRPPRAKPKEEQLIRFESTESEPEAQFDPFAQNSTKQVTQPSVGDSSFEGSPNLERSQPQRRSLINRSPAFRTPGQETPKRNAYKPDSSPEPESQQGNPNMLFDPLAGFDKTMYPNTPDQSKSEADDPKSPSLLQDWSFSQLQSSPIVTPPTRQSYHQHSSSTNPSYNMPVKHGPLSSAPPKPRQNIAMFSPHYREPKTSNPLYLPPRTNSSSGKTSPTPAKNDPFSDLVDLHKGPQVDLVDLHKGPQVKKPTNYPTGSVAARAKQWETFD